MENFKDVLYVVWDLVDTIIQLGIMVAIFGGVDRLARLLWSIDKRLGRLNELVADEKKEEN